MKLSFSVPSKSSAAAHPIPAKAFDDDGAKDASAASKPVYYVTEFDASKPIAPDPPSKHVIPPIPNDSIRRLTKKTKDLILPDDSAAAIPSRAEENGRCSEDLMLRRYREDMERLPDDRGFEEFADVPVEDFAAALLAGYGWSEGEGIGRNAKEDTEAVQYSRRAGTEGIGYTPHR